MTFSSSVREEKLFRITCCSTSILKSLWFLRDISSVSADSHPPCSDFFTKARTGICLLRAVRYSRWVYERPVLSSRELPYELPIRTITPSHSLTFSTHTSLHFFP